MLLNDEPFVEAELTEPTPNKSWSRQQSPKPNTEMTGLTDSEPMALTEPTVVELAHWQLVST